MVLLALAAAPALRIGRGAAAPPGRSLALPADQKTLTDLVAVAHDAGELRRWLYDLRYTEITVTGPSLPPPAWTPQTSDRYLDFWRLCTGPAERGADGQRIWRILPGRRPRTLALDEPPALVELTEEGDRLMARGDFTAALAAFDRAHAQAPSLALPLAHAGTCRLKLGDARGAVIAVSRALARAGPGPELLDQLGDALAASGQPGRAALAWEQAAGLDDGAARWLKAAEAMQATGNVTAAAAAARRALEREPGNRRARAVLHRLGRP